MGVIKLPWGSILKTEWWRLSRQPILNLLLYIRGKNMFEIVANSDSKLGEFFEHPFNVNSQVLP